MKIPARFPVAVLAAALLPLWGPLAARADGVVGPAPGNASHPAGINPSTGGRWLDDEGMGTRVPAARSPTGRLYAMPLEAGEEADAKREPGWMTEGFAELGVLGAFGDTRSQGFRAYKDVKDGVVLDQFGLVAGKPREARFLEITGASVGRDDQFYRLHVGRYNDWKVSSFYDGTPHAFTTSYRSLWTGIGTNNLALAGLKPGGSASAAATQAAVQAAIAAAPEQEVGLARRKAGVRVDKVLGESWKAYADFTHERREGARPFGAVFGGGGGGGNVEITEAIDYVTQDLVAGVQYAGAASSFNVRAAASFFRNEIDTMTFQNPLYVSLNGTSGLSPTRFTQGRFDLAPDNQHYNVKAEYAHALPDFYRAQFTAAAAIGSMRQNDALVAPTEDPLTGGTVNPGGAPLANNWNTPAALSQPSANARLDTRLVDLALRLKPASALDVKGTLRYYETRNSSEYFACNPLTGQWGRLLNDGTGTSLAMPNTGAGVNPAGTSALAYDAARCNLAALLALNLVPATGNVPYRSVPNDYRQLNAGVAADYRVGRASSLNASLERETFHRDYRDRDETWEDKLKLGFVERGLFAGTLRLSYEHDRRAGSAYNRDTYLPFVSASLGPTPAANGANVASWIPNLDQLRRYDLADRRQDIFNGRVDYTFLPSLDGAVTLRWKDIAYPADYGRTGHQKSGSLTLDLAYQAGPQAVVYGFYSRQSGSMEQRGVQANACVIGTTYYFYSDGRVLGAATGAPAPATPAGTTLVGTQRVLASSWNTVCAQASPASPLFPDSRTWEIASRDRNDTLGLGLRYDFGRAKLDANFSRVLGRTRIDYTYNAAALGLTDAQAALAGSGLSDLTFAQSIFDASVLVPLDRTMALRFVARYETGRTRDWHYDGVGAAPMPAAGALYLDAGPQDYRATVVGIFLHVRL